MSNTTQALKVLALAISIAIVPNALAKKGGNAGGGNGGDPEPQYYTVGDLAIDAVSTNLSFEDIIFRATQVDLSEFAVSDPNNGGSCPGFDLTTGTLVLAPRDSAVPGSATLRFGFQGHLSGGGKFTQYFLELDGEITDGDWPPVDSDVTSMRYSTWSISAENRKSRKSDCEGDGDFAAGNEVLVAITPYTP
jgi:hypothetical protein